LALAFTSRCTHPWPGRTTVKLSIIRKGEEKPIEISVTRAKIVIPLVQSKMLDGNIAYVSLYDFSAQATEQLNSSLQTLLNQKPKGLIFDLRDNPGGFLQQGDPGSRHLPG